MDSPLLPWLRSLLAALVTLTAYAALRYIPISEFMTIFLTKPIPVTLACHLLLGEPFTRIQLAACRELWPESTSVAPIAAIGPSTKARPSVISLGAIVLIYQPPFLFGQGDGTENGEEGTWNKLLGYTLSLAGVALFTGDGELGMI